MQRVDSSHLRQRHEGIFNARWTDSGRRAFHEEHPDRDEQFPRIVDQTAAFQTAKQPVIAVDAQKKKAHVVARDWRRRSNGPPYKESRTLPCQTSANSGNHDAPFLRAEILRGNVKKLRIIMLH